MVEGVMRRVAICLLAGAGTMGAVGGWSAPAQAARLSQGVARPSVAATQQPRAGGGTASASRASQAPPSTSFGFDACAAPSQKAMSAWAKSPYRTIGVYVGGLNRACAQPNLTTGWVTAQLAAGWRLIPTFVGRQAPESSCGGCAKFGGARATELGAEEAREAVADMQAIGIGARNPIYFDMEAYGSSGRRAALAFLEAWTRQLHALGYVSGVYSSSASGIADLASRLGGGYAEPDDVWIAEWNGEANTYAPLLPSEAWQPHHRLHQYEGGHNETYGGVTINIDNDYVDGDVVGAAAPPPPLAVPRAAAGGYAVSVTVACGLPPEASCPGQIVLRAYVLAGARGAAGARVVRVGIARRGFALSGARTHAFRVALNSRGRALLRRRGAMKAQLLVAIPGARVTKGLVLRLG